MRFFFFGNPNIIAMHKTTLEITKDGFLTEAGDCIIGIKSDFDFEEIKKIKARKDVKNVLRIDIDGEILEIKGILNPNFSSIHEMVLRKSDFKDYRTLMTGCDKAALDFPRGFVDKLKNPESKFSVELCEGN
jgi:hypothetical protein